LPVIAIAMPAPDGLQPDSFPSKCKSVTIGIQILNCAETCSWNELESRSGGLGFPLVVCSNRNVS
jgi:hypothetical protein